MAIKTALRKLTAIKWMRSQMTRHGSVTANVVTASLAQRSFLAAIIFFPVAIFQLGASTMAFADSAYSVSEKTVSRADGSKQPLDLSPETIRRAIRAAEADRVAYFTGSNGRRPGVDGPWASGSPRAHNQIAALRVFTIDANDKGTCLKLAREIVESQIKPARPEDKIENLCSNPQQRGNLAQVVLIENQDPNEFQMNLDASFLTSTDRTLANDTRNLALGMAGTMGVLWSMPGTTTGWDKEAIRRNPNGLFSEYKNNISRGPRWDDDNKFLNFVAHPAAGAAYYTLSRHNGKSPLESFGYAVAMSTFFWEYGFEAFVEIPSMQDLIITPLFGALLGEVAFQYENQIRNNDGQVLGSKTLGAAAMIVLNPAGALSDAINSVLGAKVIKDAKADLVLKRYRPVLHEPGLKTMIGIQFTFLF